MGYYCLCDVCHKILDNDTDEVEIRYAFKKRPDSILKTRKTVNLCHDCYKKIFGDQLEQFKDEVIKWENED